MATIRIRSQGAAKGWAGTSSRVEPASGVPGRQTRWRAVGDYGPNNTQTAAAERPTNQISETQNNQSSLVTRLKALRSAAFACAECVWCDRQFRLGAWRGAIAEYCQPSPVIMCQQVGNLCQSEEMLVNVL